MTLESVAKSGDVATARSGIELIPTDVYAANLGRVGMLGNLANEVVSAIIITNTVRWETPKYSDEMFKARYHHLAVSEELKVSRMLLDFAEGHEPKAAAAEIWAEKYAALFQSGADDKS